MRIHLTIIWKVNGMGNLHMPASVYEIVFQDPDCKKLAPSKLEIGTYTTDTVQSVGSCMFHLVHPDTKCLQK